MAAKRDYYEVLGVERGVSAEELKTKGIKDYQLHYAVQTLRRTAPTALAKKR